MKTNNHSPQTEPWTAIGKKLPYTTPPQFVDHMQAQVWQAIGKSQPQVLPHRRKQPLWLTAAPVAAAIATVLLLRIWPTQQAAPTLNDVEKTFSLLDESDRGYVLEVYQNDEFLNDELPNV